MSSIGYARDVRRLVEFRAACIWLRFWLATPTARCAGPPASCSSDVPRWPTLRDHPGNWADVPGQVALADVAALDPQYRHDCSPWRNRQSG